MEPSWGQVIIYCVMCSCAIVAMLRLLWMLVKAIVEHGNY